MTGNGRENYRDWIASTSIEKSSKTVLALDLDGDSKKKVLARALRLVAETAEYCCAIRFGRQTVLNLGTAKTSAVVSRAHKQSIPCIIDDKLADIGATNTAIAKAYYRLGFDGIIVNPLPGWEDGLEPVFRLSHQNGKGVIVLVYMSHVGARETFGQKVSDGRKTRYQFEKYAGRVVDWKADGAVVGATRPNIIRRVKPILAGKVPIYSPGVGAQGGDFSKARRAGTDYFIIGRSITKSKSPSAMAAKYAQLSQ